MTFGKRYLNQNIGHGEILMRLTFLGMPLGGGKTSKKPVIILSKGHGLISVLGG